MTEGGALTTQGTLLGGAVAYTQPEAGYRTGLEPVLLAASVPARPGERVLEAGTGAGAGLLALSARVANLAGTGIEIDPAQAALARQNLAANQRTAIGVETADIETWTAPDVYDHAFANPPWHGDRNSLSPSAGRRQAKQAAPGLLDRWVQALAQALRRRGTLSLILPAALLGEGVTALCSGDCREITLIPLWPRPREASKLIILRGVRQGLGGCTVNAGLVLHRQDGGLTEAAEAILRDGAALAASPP